MSGVVFSQLLSLSTHLQSHPVQMLVDTLHNERCCGQEGVDQAAPWPLPLSHHQHTTTNQWGCCCPPQAPTPLAKPAFLCYTPPQNHSTRPVRWQPVNPLHTAARGVDERSGQGAGPDTQTHHVVFEQVLGLKPRSAQALSTHQAMPHSTSSHQQVTPASLSSAPHSLLPSLPPENPAPNQPAWHKSL